MGMRRRADNRGVTLVEMVVVLVLVGLMAGLTAVALTPKESALRTAVKSIPFDLELAKYESISRNVPIFVEFFLEDPEVEGVDYNDDGRVDDRDRCYVIYGDWNNNNRFDEDADPPERIKAEPVDHTIRVTTTPDRRAAFSPLGKSNQLAITIEGRTVKDCNNDSYADCLVTTYPLELSPTGRTTIGEMEETCLASSPCTESG